MYRPPAIEVLCEKHKPGKEKGKYYQTVGRPTMLYRSGCGTFNQDRRQTCKGKSVLTRNEIVMFDGRFFRVLIWDIAQKLTGCLGKEVAYTPK